MRALLAYPCQDVDQPMTTGRRNGKREEGSRQKKITNDRQYQDKWTYAYIKES